MSFVEVWQVGSLSKVTSLKVEENEKYIKRHKDLMWFGQSNYVYKGDEKYTKNMIEQNTK